MSSQHQTAVIEGAGILREKNGSYQEGLRNLYAEHGKTLFRYALALTCSVEDAEDAVQDVFVKVVREWKRFGKVKNVKSYLFSSVRNSSFDILRSRQRRNALCDVITAEMLAGTNTAREVHADTVIALRQAVAELPIEQREVLILKAVHEMSFKDIASITKVSINTAAGRYRYGLERMRKILEANDNG